MKQFCDENFLLNTKTAHHLYQAIKNDPIMDYHNHLSAKELSENIKFENLTQLWLSGDHYKWRQMRTCGISERLITGDAPDYEKFLAFVGALESMIGNPVSQWAQLELKKYFNITQPLILKNAKSIWDQTAKKLQKMTCRTFLEMSNVYAICTTDDPIDDLVWHKKLPEQWTAVKVIPNFRPDQLLKIQAVGFNDYLLKLEKVTSSKINDYDSLWKALKERINFFHENGCRSSDHGISKFRFIPTNRQELNEIVVKKIEGGILTPEEVAKFDSALLLDLARTYSELNWAMLLHITVERDNNPVLLNSLGHDIGCDSTSENLISESLNGFLATLKAEDKLCKISIFSLNPINWPAVASLIGNYQDNEKGIAGLVQFGTAWWFADTYSGNRQQIQMFAELSSLGTNIGMLTDSRSYSSFARHDYYRRVLCDIVGEWAEQGMCVNDLDILTKLVKNVAFKNAYQYFGYTKKATKTLELVNLSVEDTKIINESQALRSELCGDIFKGGLTPSFELIKAVDKVSQKPIRVILRPNGADFQVTDAEFEDMKKTIELCKTMKHVEGVVFSIITQDHQIDVARNKELVQLAKPLKSVFCKGFDYLKNSAEFIDLIYEMGFSGILTQGGLSSIDENFDYFIKHLLTHPLVINHKMEIIAAGGVGLKNIAKIKGQNFKTLHAGNLVREDLTYNTNLDLKKINQLTNEWKMKENEKHL